MTRRLFRYPLPFAHIRNTPVQSLREAPVSSSTDTREGSPPIATLNEGGESMVLCNDCRTVICPSPQLLVEECLSS